MVDPREYLEFEILGFKVKFKPDNDVPNAVDVKEVIQAVEREALKIKSASPHLDNGKIALLVALHMAMETKSIEAEYRENVTKIRILAKETAKLIDMASHPSS